MNRRLLILILLVLLPTLSLLHPQTRAVARWGWGRLAGGATLEQRLDQHGPTARARLASHFEQAQVPYPPRELLLIGIKDSRQLELWARGTAGEPWQWITAYPILAASGDLGPKLREGDRQVPEGVYAIESLNPNSLYHLALRVNYPNAFDRQMGEADGRTHLGSDIMIHGSNRSVGCLAMGDDVAEDLFVLVAETGLANTSLVLTPVDFRVRDLPANMPAQPQWTATLYQSLRERLAQLPPPPTAPPLEEARLANHPDKGGHPAPASPVLTSCYFDTS